MMEAVEKATASLTATSAATLGYLSPTEPWEIAAVEPPFKQFKLPPLPLVDVPSAPHVTLSNWTSPQKRAAYRQLLRHQQPNRTQQQQQIMDTTTPDHTTTSSSHASPTSDRTSRSVMSTPTSVHAHAAADMHAQSAASMTLQEATSATTRASMQLPSDMPSAGFKGRWHCQRCKRNFASQQALDTHNKSSMHLRPHRCQACGKRFARRSHLRVHEKIHLGIKDQICPICNRGFVQASNLRAHMRIHSGERPYHCHLCPKSFSVSSSLKAHLKSHQRKNEHSTTDCPKCGDVLPDHDSLNFHITQCQGKEDVRTQSSTLPHVESTGRKSNSPGERSGADPSSPAQAKQAAKLVEHNVRQHHVAHHSHLDHVMGVHDDDLMAVAASLLDSAPDLDWPADMDDPLASVTM
eukprot:TRINITY_DN7691_c0_g1_i2.p1 TRINITY_DN7691_c0_g1~~TRINITY_DN7691_c0_g1_i2.p1  ORF type:complete len:408 (+),score=92.54 TRINITY_DN7691_c0_g1_i2:562-1785(+)